MNLKTSLHAFLFSNLIFYSLAQACLNSSSADRIIYIGDSHSTHQFGETLASALQADPSFAYAEIKRYAVAGTSADAWNGQSGDHEIFRKEHTQYYCDGDGKRPNVPTPEAFPNLADLVKGTPPKAIIIALGTNDMGGNCKKGSVEQMQDVVKLLQKIPKNTPCIWVGPTAMIAGPIFNKCGEARENAFADNLRDTVTGRVSLQGDRKSRAVLTYAYATADRLRKTCSYVDGREIRGNQKSVSLPAEQLTVDQCTSSSLPQIHPDNGDGYHYAKGSLYGKYWAHCTEKMLALALHNYRSNEGRSLAAPGITY